MDTVFSGNLVFILAQLFWIVHYDGWYDNRSIDYWWMVVDWFANTFLDVQSLITPQLSARCSIITNGFINNGSVLHFTTTLSPS